MTDSLRTRYPRLPDCTCQGKAAGAVFDPSAAWCPKCGRWVGGACGGWTAPEKGAVKALVTAPQSRPKTPLSDPKTAESGSDGAVDPADRWAAKRRIYRLQAILAKEPEEYRRVFLEQNWPPPWTCFWCGAGVAFKKLTVHHRDGDHDNSNHRNLAAAHTDCHWAAHDAEERGVQRERDARNMELQEA